VYTRACAGQRPRVARPGARPPQAGPAGRPPAPGHPGWSVASLAGRGDTLPKRGRRSRGKASQWRGGGGRGVTHSRGRQTSFDTSVAHVARIYNYWLGGKDNFAADRAAGEQAIKAFPNIMLSARANRAFLARAVRFLAEEAGIRQFLDIGTGIPSANNTHE